MPLYLGKSLINDIGIKFGDTDSSAGASYDTCKVYFQPSLGLKLSLFSGTIVNDGELDIVNSDTVFDFMSEGGLIAIENVLQGSAIGIGLRNTTTGSITCDGVTCGQLDSRGYITAQIPTGKNMVLFDYVS